MDDHMMDELTLEQRRQMEQMPRTQTVDQRMTQDETQHMGQGLATAQREQKDLSVLQQIDAIPVSCCKTEQELDEEVEAAGKLGRRAVLESQQDERRAIQEQRQEYVHFYQLAEDYPNRLTAQLEQTEIYNEDTVSKALESCVDGLETHKLLKGNVQDDSGITELCKVFEQLRATSVDTVTAERMEQLHAAYLKLGYADADLIGKQYFDTEAAKGAYVILFYNVAAQLFEQLSGRRKDAVDQEQLARLYGIATTSALAVGTLCASDEFRQQLKGLKEERGRKEQEERERKEQEERERKAQEERERKAKEERERKEQEERERKAKEERERKEQEERERKDKEERERKEQEALARNLAYIRQGTLEDGETPAEWPMADYAEMAERIFGEAQLRTLLLEELSRSVAHMQEVMESNVKVIDKAAREAGEVYRLPMLHAALTARLTALVGDQMLNKRYEMKEMQELLQQAKQQLSQEYAVYQEYADYLKSDEMFSKVVDAFSNKQLQKYMTGESIGEFKAKLAPFRAQIQANLSRIHNRMQETLTEQLQTPALEAFLQTEGMILLDGSEREINMKLDWYLDHLRVNAPQLFDKSTGVTADNYLKKPRQLDESRKKANKNSNESIFENSDESAAITALRARLGGEELFGWEGFGENISVFDTGDTVQLLDDVLRDHHFSQEYLKNVRCVQDLETLQDWQMAEFMGMLRANMAETFADWVNIQGPMEQRLRQDLLPGMLAGTVTKDTFLSSVNKLLQQYETTRELQKQRRNVLLGLAKKPHGKLRFRYLDVMANTAVKSEPRNISRARRFEHAAEVHTITRQKLKDGTFDDRMAQVMGVLWQNVNGEADPENLKTMTSREISKKVLAMYKDVITENRRSLAAQKKHGEQVDLLKKLETEMKADGEYGLELALDGAEDLFLENESFRKAFAAEPNEVYEQKLAEFISVYKRRYYQVCYRYHSYDVAETVREALAGLEVLDQDVEERKKRNLKRFGVESFDQLLQYMDEYQNADAFEKEQVQESVDRYEKRLERLRTMRGGLYEPLLNDMKKDDQVFEALTILPDAAYEAYVEKLDGRLFAMMQQLDQVYGIHSGFAEQVLLQYGTELVQGSIQQSQWEMKLYKYYGQISDYSIGGHSISQTFRDIVEEKPKLAPYLIAILLDKEQGSMLLADEKKWNETEKIYSKNITLNERELAETIPDQQEYKKLQQYLLVHIATERAEDFQEHLPGYLETYRRQKSAEQESAVRAAQTLEDRRWVLLDIEVKKERGRRSDEADRALLRSMKQGREQLTPVIMTYRQPQAAVPDGAAIEQAHKQVQKALEDQIVQLPDIVTDLLTERMIAEKSGMSGSALRREAEHLAELLRKENELTAEKAGERQDSLLTYLYCRERLMQERDKDKNKDKDKEEEDIAGGIEAYRQTELLLTSVTELPVSGKFAAREKAELIRAAQVARYTMKEQEFGSFVTNRRNYVARMDALEQQCEVIAGRYETDEARAQALTLGLLTYYREELHSEQPLDIRSITADMENLLKDEHVRTYLAQTKAQLMESTGSDALTAEEQQTDAVMDREHFEQELEVLLDQTAKKQYNPLSVQQRKIFALALCAPGIHAAVSGLTGYRLVREDEDDDVQLMAIHTQVQRYIHHDRFAPQIDYARALYQLQTPKQTFDRTAFGQAMTFVQTVESSRQAQYEPDYAILCDAGRTIEAAGQLAPAGSAAKQHAHHGQNLIDDSIRTSKQFVTWLREADGLDGKLAQRLEQLQRDQVLASRLIRILQDRTVADYSTGVGAAGRAAGQVTLFVNEGKRLAMIEQAQKGTDITGNGQTSVHIAQAMRTLLSYQLRNDIPIRGEQLAAGDFAPGALARKTDVDWELLERAMDLADEMNRAQMRIKAIRQAPQLIDQCRNEKAKKAYHANEVHTQEDFEKFLEEQAQEDGRLAVLAGYRMLDQAERTLFIKALGSRWVLDVSKEHMMANRFGMIERDYADPIGRDALCDEYFESALSSAPGVELSGSAYGAAFEGMLSTQVDDSLDYTKQKNEDLSKNLSKGEQIFGDSRTTAVDWKLVMRALQLVHRCENESAVYEGDRELYISQGDLSRTGQFGFESAYMRRNLHSAGNRLTRHLGRRTAEHIKDQLPGPLVTLVRANISVNASNALAQYAAFEQQEEKQSPIEKAAGHMETLGGIAQGKAGEVLGTVSDVLGYVSDASDFLTAAANKKQLNNVIERSAKTYEKDKEKMTAAAEHQTREQAAKSKAAQERNRLLQQDAVTKATQRQTDAMIDSASSIVSRALGSIVETGGDTLGTVVTETGKIINLIRNYQNDKASVRAYFESMGELQRLRREMESENKMEKLYHASDPLELIRQARGYEDYTEMASFVGLNVTRSLLFCASAFNRQESLRRLAIATLKVLGMEDVIGKWDNDSAERVYAAIMGSEYR